MRSFAITMVLVGAVLLGCGDDEPSGTSETSTTSSASSGGAGGTSSTGGESTAGGGGAAPEPDFSCEGVPWPTRAPDPMLLGGGVYDTTSDDPLAGAAVTVLSMARGTTLAETTSDAVGAYSVSLPTGGEALALYTKVEAPGYVPSYAFPPYAFWQDEPSRNLPVFSLRDLEALAPLLGGGPNPDLSVVIVNARDCAGDAVEGATVSLSPSALFTGYFDDAGVHPGDTTSSEGILVGAGVEPGPLEVTITYAGHTWRTWTIETFPGSMVYTPRRP